MTERQATPGTEPPVDEAELQAMVDDRLPPGRRQAVAAWLAAHPEQQARVRALRAHRDLLRAGLAGVLEEPVPARLCIEQLVAARQQGRRLALRRLGQAAGALAAGVALGWFGRDLWEGFRGQGPGERLAAEAVAAHRVFVPDARRPVEVAAAQEAQLVQWLSNRLGRRLAAPDLTPLGFQLVGGRLLPGDAGRPAAQLMYQDGRGERLTLYLRADPAEQETAFRFLEDPASGVAAFWWVDRSFGYAVAAKLDRSALLRVADAVYHQLGGS